MTSLLNIDADAFANAFARRCVKVRHELTSHPLFEQEAIAQLADQLPPSSVRREPGDLPLSHTRGFVEAGVGRPSETVREIEENGFRVSLRDVQQLPEYARLVNQCLDEAAQYVAGREGGMKNRAGYIFVTAPASTTPMHYDAEHSFLLQVCGTKHVFYADLDDPIVKEQQLQRYYRGEPLDTDLMHQHATKTTIQSGEGVYIPSYVPHWVVTEQGLSISFSIPFYTPYTEKLELINLFNMRLGRFKVRTKPAGGSPIMDQSKIALSRAWLRMSGKANKTWA